MMKLGLARVCATLTFLSFSIGVPACKDDGGSKSGGSGGSGEGGSGEGGSGEGGAGDGGKGGSKAGGAGGTATQGGTAGTGTTGGAGGTMPAMREPIPEPVIEDYAAATGKLPVTIGFETAADLTGKFFKVGKATHSADAGGSVKVTKGDAVSLIYDTTPDATRTDTFEDFTATIKFRSASHGRLWVSFATDKNRNDGFVVDFDIEHGQEGPAGVSDVESIHRVDRCWAANLFAGEPNCAGTPIESYGWTAIAPHATRAQTIKLTVKTDKAKRSIKTRAEWIDFDDVLIDHSEYEWMNNDVALDQGGIRVNRINGEIGFGVQATNSDIFIDEVTIKAAEPFVDNGVVFAEGTNAHIWIPTGLAAGTKLKGLITAEPALGHRPNGKGDFALFEHLRRFATAYGWGVLGGMRGGMDDFKTHFAADLDKLATATGRQEIKTVPIFIHSLLDTLPYQALSDDAFNKRLLGFLSDKPRFGGDLNAGMEETYEQYPMSAAGRAIPGFIVYAQVSPISLRTAGSIVGMWYGNRYPMDNAEPAYWALTNHGPQTNAVVDSWMLYLALAQELIKERTVGNDGTSALKPVDRSKGYLGTSDFFKVRPAAETPVIAPFPAGGWPAAEPMVGKRLSDPQPDFLLNASMALTWQAWEYYKFVFVMVDGKPVPKFIPKKAWWVQSPRHGKVGENRLLKVGFAPELNGWKKVEFLDASSATPMTPLHTVNAGGAAEYEYKNLTRGAHSFIARVTGPDDVIHMTHPVMAIFTP